MQLHVAQQTESSHSLLNLSPGFTNTRNQIVNYVLAEFEIAVAKSKRLPPNNPQSPLPGVSASPVVSEGSPAP